jgi:hypothetical protein
LILWEKEDIIAMNRLQNEECGKKNFKNLYFTNEIEKPLKK